MMLQRISDIKESKSPVGNDFVMGLDIDAGSDGKPRLRLFKLSRILALIGGSAGIVKDSISHTTPLIDKNERQETQIQIAKSFGIYRFTTNFPTWVRMYATTAHQIADRNRNYSQDPIGNHGVLLEVATKNSFLSLDLSPTVSCYFPTDFVPITIVNLEDVANQITVNFDCLILEV